MKTAPILSLALPTLLGACTGEPNDLSANPEPGTTDAGEAVVWPSLPDLDAELLRVMSRGRVPGMAVCLVDGDSLRWCQGYGSADAAGSRPVLSSTPFLLASVAKTVVATALAQAWEASHLDLDEDINATLSFSVAHPDAPSAPITPRMLAAHTSGIADNWDVLDDVYTWGADSPLDLGDFLQSYLVPGGSRYSANDNFVGDGPGDENDYTNLGYGLLAHVIERAVGQPFDRWCEDQIFAPLGMNAAWFLSQMDVSELAVPLERRGGRFEELGHYGFADYPSGQLRASAVDTARFLRAVMNEGEAKGVRLLEASSVRELLTVQYPRLDPEQGLGWYSWDLDGETVWGHNGGEYGSTTEVIWSPRRELGVVVLMNAEVDEWVLEEVELLILDAAADL